MSIFRHINTFIKAKIFIEGKEQNVLKYLVEELYYMTSDSTAVCDVLYELKKRGIVKSIVLENFKTNTKILSKRDIYDQVQKFSLIKLLDNLPQESCDYWRFILKIAHKKVILLKKDLEVEIEKFRNPKNKKEKQELLKDFPNSFGYEKQKVLIMEEIARQFSHCENRMINFNFAAVNQQPQTQVYPLHILISLQQDKLINLLKISNKKVSFNDYAYAGIEILDKFIEEYATISGISSPRNSAVSDTLTSNEVEAKDSSEIIFKLSFERKKLTIEYDNNDFLVTEPKTDSERNYSPDSLKD